MFDVRRPIPFGCALSLHKQQEKMIRLSIELIRRDCELNGTRSAMEESINIIFQDKNRFLRQNSNYFKIGANTGKQRLCWQCNILA